MNFDCVLHVRVCLFVKVHVWTFISEVEEKEASDTLTFSQVQSLLASSPLAEMVRPSHSQTLCLWGAESSYSHVELEYGTSIRLKTKGDSLFIGVINIVWLFVSSFYCFTSEALCNVFVCLTKQ